MQVSFNTTVIKTYTHTMKNVRAQSYAWRKESTRKY